MIGQIERDDDTTNIFPFIIQRIQQDLESDTEMDSIVRRKLETELCLLEKIDGYCDVPEIGRTIDQVKEDINKYICTFLNPAEFTLSLCSNDILVQLQQLRKILNNIFEETNKEIDSDDQGKTRNSM